MARLCAPALLFLLTASFGMAATYNVTFSGPGCSQPPQVVGANDVFTTSASCTATVKNSTNTATVGTVPVSYDAKVGETINTRNGRATAFVQLLGKSAGPVSPSKPKP